MAAALPATQNFEANNKEILAHGKDVEIADVQQKLQTCLSKL